MPSRVIRHEINHSESLRRVSIGADLCFRALLVAVDDYGRIDARRAMLKAALFPVREEVTEVDIEGWIHELSVGQSAPVQVYHVGDLPFIQLTAWEKYISKQKRAKNSRYPDPPEVDDSAPPDIPGYPRNIPLGVGVGVGDEVEGVGGVEGEVGLPAADAAPSDGGQNASPVKAKSKRRTSAPEHLVAAQWTSLQIWIREKQAWLVDDRLRQRALVEACLDHHRAKGTTSTDWVLNARNWIRNEVQFGRAGPGGGGNGRARRKPGGITEAVDNILAEIDAEERAEQGGQPGDIPGDWADNF